MYPSPATERVTDDTLPSFSLSTGVNCASTVASPVPGLNTGRFLYPKPCPVNVTQAIGNPIVEVAVAPDPVVSPAPRVNPTVGADVYTPP